MALIKCPECGSEISDKATTCPQCGCPISNKTVFKKRRKIYIPIIMLILVVGVVITYFVISNGRLKLSNKENNTDITNSETKDQEYDAVLDVSQSLSSWGAYFASAKGCWDLLAESQIYDDEQFKKFKENIIQQLDQDGTLTKIKLEYNDSIKNFKSSKTYKNNEKLAKKFDLLCYYLEIFYEYVYGSQFNTYFSYTYAIPSMHEDAINAIEDFLDCIEDDDKKVLETMWKSFKNI